MPREFFGCQAVTPETERTSHYFFQQSHGFALDDPAVTENLTKACWRDSTRTGTSSWRSSASSISAPDAPMLAMRMDTALASFRALMEKAMPMNGRRLSSKRSARSRSIQNRIHEESE